jgi:hypothetical protein
MFLFTYFLFASTTCFGPYGIYTSQSLEAVMPTADPFFLIGYTIITYICFVFGEFTVVGFLIHITDTSYPRENQNSSLKHGKLN